MYRIQVITSVYTEPGQAWLNASRGVTSNRKNIQTYPDALTAGTALDLARHDHPQWQLTIEPVPYVQAHTETRLHRTTNDQGYETERTAIVITANGHGNSVDVLDAEGRLACRINFFDHAAEVDQAPNLTIDVCLLADNLKGAFLARVAGKPIINETLPDCKVFTTCITPV